MQWLSNILYILVVSQGSKALLWTTSSLLMSADKAGSAAQDGKRSVASKKKAASSAAEEMVSPKKLESYIGFENLMLFDNDERSVLELLVEKKGQEHLVKDWPKAGTDDAQKKKFVKTLLRLDTTYVGGLGAYVDKARKLLASSAAGENPFGGLDVELPEGESLGDSSQESYMKAEARGIEAASRGLGFVLVAGGLGERLGYEGIKLELPVDGLSERNFLDMYREFVAALAMKTGKKNLPLAIMTSDDTDARTRDLVAAKEIQGCEVQIIKQDKVAALSDGDASIALDDKYSVGTKPHGHGDVHTLMRTSGLARQWLDDYGLEYLFFFQDTNALVLHTVLPALGVTLKRDFSVNSVCVPRRAGEAAGAIAKLIHKDSEKNKEPPLVINVEYNQLDPLLRADDGEGDVNDPETGFSPFPGNANILVIKLHDYVTTIEGKDRGVVDEFVNPKYADATKTKFKKPTRLECMMQDYPKLLIREVPNAKVGFTTFDRWIAFSPAKNDLSTARALSLADEPPSAAGSTEFDVYKAHALKANLYDDTSEQTQTLGGISGIYAGPRIIFGPFFATTASDLRTKIPHPNQCHIDSTAALYVDGSNIRIDSISLKGMAAVTIINKRSDASLLIKDLAVQSDKGGLVFEDIPDDDLHNAKPSDRIRGYTTTLMPTLTINIDRPGAFLLTGEGELTELDQEPDL